MKKSTKRFLFIGFALLILGVFFGFNLDEYLSFTYVKSQQSEFQIYFAQNPFPTIATYFSIYVLVTALSLPGATVMTLVGGMLFGVLWGTLIVSFASTIGATLAFLASRFLFRDFVQKKFGNKLKAVNEGIQKEGKFYLFTLRLIPAFPFFVINMVMGLTSIKVLTYFVVSQIGMLPGTIVYVNAGTQLSKLENLSGIVSPSLLLSFALLGILPLTLKKAMAWVKKRRKSKI
ncbi:MAG: TVP38/TMEM64 family protein [Bdellovibrionales bacterium]|nr:TVP38/TMEM64 family protein [Bdellovibrionales bacterium]